MRSILMVMGMFGVVVTVAGCADLLGIDPWEDNPGDSSSSAGGGKEDGSSSTAGGVDPCHNGVQDGAETGVDCGGDTCGLCADARGCATDSDCVSEYCPATRGYCISDNGRGKCAVENTGKPTCADCMTNGAESDIDCGGDVCLPCRPGKICIDDVDCWSGTCSNGVCAAGLAKTRCFSNADCMSAVCAKGSAGCMYENCCQ
jgi:hypothetical protein